ncbi:MAG: adaptor protein MecA [Ruminiclostridium sp.]|nr:adaptor protein MecA [Ruminiclostridium sp.]
MYYDALSRNTVKITLSRKDMKEYSLKSESIRSRTAESKRSLMDFLKRFRSESALFPEHNAERLFLEAFPSEDGGCVLYVSTLGTEPLPQSATENRTRLLMCRTDTLDDTSRLCRGIGDYIDGSKLYRLSGSYFLILKVSEGDTAALSHIAGEYGVISDNTADIAYITEHGKLICACDAVKKLAGLV